MQTIVGVLRGGPSREHAVSLQTGATMLAHLPKEQFEARDIYIDRQGQWHDRGKQTSPERALRQIDVALIGLHGDYGPHGSIQKIVSRYGVPYAGSDAFGSYLASHKMLSKSRAEEEKLTTPKCFFIEQSDDASKWAHEAVRAFHQPMVVKPVGWGSSVGVEAVGGFAAVMKAVDSLFSDGASSVLIEECVRGREVTVGVVEQFRGESLSVLPPLEIILPNEAKLYSYEMKLKEAVKHTEPAKLSRVEREELQRAAKVMHRTLGLRHYSRSDFIVTPKGIYYLETNAMPAVTKNSSMTRLLEAAGISLKSFFSHLVNLARSR